MRTGGPEVFGRRWKQLTGFAWKQRTGNTLWQKGYFDRVLRSDESDLEVIAYIIDNPVRAGLVRSPEEYPLTGSSVYTWAELMVVARL